MDSTFTFPGGDYLSRLEALCLGKLQAVPGDIAAATNLRVLQACCIQRLEMPETLVSLSRRVTPRRRSSFRVGPLSRTKSLALRVSARFLQGASRWHSYQGFRF